MANSLTRFLVRSLSFSQLPELRRWMVGGVPSLPTYLLILCSAWILR